MKSRFSRADFHFQAKRGLCRNARQVASSKKKEGR